MTPVTSIRILLIDDDVDDRKLVIDMLSEAKRAKFLVDEAGTGGTGLEKLRATRYDVVFLDYKLPDKNGLSVLKDIIDLRFNVPVAIITNMNEVHIQNDALELGATDFLEKGKFTTDTLERTCLYAIGLHEKKTKNGSGPGVGVLMEQLVGLTRDNIKAQTQMTQETREFRRELGDGLKYFGDRLTNQEIERKNNYESLSNKIDDRNSPKTKWMFDWIANHPVIAFALLMSIITLIVILAVLGIMFFEHISTEKIKAMKDFVGFLIMDNTAVIRRWIA